MAKNPITGEMLDPPKEAQEEKEDNIMLKLRQMRGFNGAMRKGLNVHPGGKHFVYAMGKHVVVEQINKKYTGSQEILSKHRGVITRVCVSEDGRYIASGDRGPGVSKAHVILWDFATRSPIMDLESHTSSVADMTFLYGGHYLVSLGDDDDSQVMLWSTMKKAPRFVVPAQLRREKTPVCLAASKIDGFKFMTGGDAVGRIWTISPDGNSLDYKELNFGNKLHSIITIEIADKECTGLPMAFCGTSSGDILIFSMTNGNLQAAIPKKTIPNGVTAITYVRMMDEATFNILVGTGSCKVMNFDVTLTFEKKNCVAVTKYSSGTNIWSTEMDSTAVTSIVKLHEGNIFYVGTAFNHVYEMNLFRWTGNLVKTSSNQPILALAFARGTDDLLVTGEHGQVRVLNLQKNTEARRYLRANRTCQAVVVNHDGTNIFTGWDGGEVIVLGFEPSGMTLRELYRIDRAQKQAVNALALTSDSEILVSGGGDGQTRVWRLVDDYDARGKRLRQGLLMHQLIHSAGCINTIQISQDDKRCLSSSQDGSAVVYELTTGARVAYVKWDTSLNAACFCSMDLQLLTANNDGVLRYWEVNGGEFLREVEGVKAGAVNTISIRNPKCPATVQFATGGSDALVKLWNFERGEITHIGKGHSQEVICCKFGPCGTILVSSSQDGSLCIWDMTVVDV